MKWNILSDVVEHINEILNSGLSILPDSPIHIKLNNFLKKKIMTKLYTPLGDRVLVEPIKEEETKSNIILTNTIERGDAVSGKVVLAGPGVYTQNGELITTTVKVGDLVLYRKDMVGDKIEVNGGEYLLFREQDLLMVHK